MSGAVAVLLFKDNAINCPDVLNSVRAWAAHGYGVDLLDYDTGLYAQPAFPGETRVRVLPLRTLYGRLLPLVRRLRGLDPASGERPGARGAADAPVPGPAAGRSGVLFGALVRLFRTLQKAEFVVAHALRLIFGGYRLAVACDLPSLLAARAARALRGTPYLYHSRELALSWDQRSLRARVAKRAERHCHRAALLTTVQDGPRAALLARDNRVAAEGFVIVPNSPMGLWEGGTNDALAERLGLPAGAPIVLYAGAIVPETMVLEIIESIGGWPPEAVLVIHGVPESVYFPALRRAAARFPGRVVFSPMFVAFEEVDRLYAGAAAGLAFYRPIDDNFRYVGHAAGKIFNLMKVGVPVIANDLPGLPGLIDGNGCGRTVADPAGIGPALREILADPAPWRERCLATFPRFEFGGRYDEVVRRFEALG